MEIDSDQKMEEIDVQFRSLTDDLENSAKRLDTDQKDGFKRIDNCNNTIFLKIEEHKITIATRINNTKSHFRSVYTRSSKLLDKYSDTIDKILSNLIEFEFLLIILILPNVWELFISVFPQYASIIPIPPEYAKPIFILQLTFLLIIVIIFYRRFNKGNSNLDTEKIGNLEEELKNIDELQNIPYNVDSEIENQ